MQDNAVLKYSASEKFLILMGVIMVLTPTGWLLPFKLLGWVVLASFMAGDRRLTLALLAFFSAFFSGFGGIPVLITVKPAQIVVGFLLARATQDWRHGRISGRPSRCLLYLAVVAAIGLASIAGSPDPVKATRMEFNLLLVLLIPLLCEIYVRSTEEIRTMMRMFSLGTFVLAAFQIAVFLIGFELFGYQGLSNNNHSAFLYTSGIVLTLPFLSETHRPWARAGSWLGIAGLFSATLLTLSRTAFAALAVAFAVLLLFEFVFWKHMRRPERAGVLLFLVLGLLAAKLLSMVWSEFYERLYSFKNLLGADYLSVTFADPNGGIFGKRWEQVREILPIFKASPLWGEGFTNRAISLHGLFFVLLASVGAVGFLAFVLFLGGVMVGLWRAGRRTLDAQIERFSGIWIAWLASWAVVSLMESYLVHFHMWLIVGLSLSTIRVAQRLESRPRGSRGEGKGSLARDGAREEVPPQLVTKR